MATLSPQECRKLGPDYLAPEGTGILAKGCSSGLGGIPPDAHSALRLHAMASRGERLQGMSDLAALLRNRMLVMLGDSMSFQVTEAMHCAAASAVGGVRTVRLRAKAPAAMVRTCRFLMQEAGKERPCGCRASADKAWRASACGLWTSLKDLEERDGHYTSIGFLMPAYNFTFLYDFDRVSKYIYESRCYVCDALPRRGGCGAPLPTGPHRRRGLLDHCATTQPLPSRVELAALLGADVIVGNWGLHVHSRVAYRRLLRGALADLDAFARRPHKAAVFRETSAQHFPVPSGDYDAALAKDPSLVRVRAEQQGARAWHGPSLCRSHMRGGASIGASLTNESGTAWGWRNAMLREELGRLPAGSPLRVQPFGERTAERWDYHESVVWQPATRSWASDCSHFCYSPSFYQLTTHALYQTLTPSY